MIYGYLLVCLLIFLLLSFIALREDWLEYKRGYRFSPEKATIEYQIAHGTKYCIPNYRNPAAYFAILCLCTPVVNLLLLFITILVLTILYFTVYDDSKPHRKRWFHPVRSSDASANVQDSAAASSSSQGHV